MLGHWLSLTKTQAMAVIGMGSVNIIVVYFFNSHLLYWLFPLLPLPNRINFPTVMLVLWRGKRLRTDCQSLPHHRRFLCALPHSSNSQEHRSSKWRPWQLWERPGCPHLLRHVMALPSERLVLLCMAHTGKTSLSEPEWGVGDNCKLMILLCSQIDEDKRRDTTQRLRQGKYDKKVNWESMLLPLLRKALWETSSLEFRKQLCLWPCKMAWVHARNVPYRVLCTLLTARRQNIRHHEPWPSSKAQKWKQKAQKSNTCSLIPWRLRYQWRTGHFRAFLVYSVELALCLTEVCSCWGTIRITES